jgi:hypothetical protein
MCSCSRLAKFVFIAQDWSDDDHCFELFLSLVVGLDLILSLILAVQMKKMGCTCFHWPGAWKLWRLAAFSHVVYMTNSSNQRFKSYKQLTHRHYNNYQSVLALSYDHPSRIHANIYGSGAPNSYKEQCAAHNFSFFKRMLGVEGTTYLYHKNGSRPWIRVMPWMGGLLKKLQDLFQAVLTIKNWIQIPKSKHQKEFRDINKLR